MRTYIRSRIEGGTYFFTVVAADRTAGLLTSNIEALRTATRYVLRRHPFALDAAVVLPDHLHALWTLPADDADYSTRWRLIKAHFSRNVPAEEAVSASRSRRGERGLWQRRYWEHVVRDECDYQRHLDYIHYNPVKHGHATAPKDWPYSSFRRFVAKGWYDLDWAAPEEVAKLDLG